MQNQFTKYFSINIFFVFLINLIFFYYTFENPFYSDDYGSIIGIKLYNLINEKLFSFSDFFYIRPDGHFVPFLYFYNQFFPYNSTLTHFIIVLSFAFTGIVVFVLTNELTKFLPNQQKIYSLIKI